MYCDWPQFQRCCFCMPLRRGVLVVAYIKIYYCVPVTVPQQLLWNWLFRAVSGFKLEIPGLLFSAFMVGVYSYAVHQDLSTELIYQGTTVTLPAELCVFIYCLECVFAALLIYGAHKNATPGDDATVTLPAELCVFIYCLECVFAAHLIYGAHKRLLMPVKVYFYFSICTLVSTVMMQIIELASARYVFFLMELTLFCFSGLCLQLYLLMLVWSLVKKLEVDGPHVYENQLHQFVNGQVKVESNGVYNPSTIPAEV